MSKIRSANDLLGICTVDELKVVREELCERVGPYKNDKTDFVNRLVQSIDRRDVDHKELVRVICLARSRVRNSQKSVTTRLRERINGMEFSNNARRRKLRERPLTSELFQALHYKFKDDARYRVIDEHQPRYLKLRPDLGIKHTNDEELYIMEVKIHSTLPGLQGQLSRYSSMIEPEKLFYCYVASEEDKIPSENEKVKQSLEEAKEICNETFVKGPNSFR